MGQITLRDVANKREPDFNNLLTLLHRGKPERPTLFEFFQNKKLNEEIAGHEIPGGEEQIPYVIQTFYTLGYDYTTLLACNFGFPNKAKGHGDVKSISLNSGAIITDLESYKAYKWPCVADAYDGRLERFASYLPEGMKFIVYGPGGVLENVIGLMGYENLCMMLYEDPALVAQIFYDVGSRLRAYYQMIINQDCVGAIISNDDWGFNTQTMLSPDDLRRMVFPWHRDIVNVAHNAGKPVILHSCGQLENVMDDIIDGIGYDAKHSYEDNIFPVEKAYDIWHDRIAVLGGIDLDFICRKSEDAIIARSRGLLEQTGCKGYALGTGNSIPEYVPFNHYYAMISAAFV